MYYQKLVKRQEEIHSQLQSLQKKIRKLPDGNLHFVHNGPYTKWFHRLNGKAEYIPKSNKKFAEQLAIRKYLTTQVEELQTEQAAINAYFQCINKNRKRTSKLLQEDSCFQPLLAPYFNSHQQNVEAWLSQPYQTNPFHPELLIHKTIAGFNVRSKSESLIVSALYTKHIPFRYECALQLGETTIYPDFTILHPKTGKKYYFEHFGQMDNPDYIYKTCKKIQLYSEFGIIPSVNLIMTFETADNPLDSELLENILQFYFS